MNKEKLIGAGNTAEIYEYAGDKILKLFKEGIPKAAAVGEYQTTANVYRLLGICPKVFERVSLEGRAGIVYERVKGKTLLEEMQSRFWRYKSLSVKMARCHSSLQKEVDFDLPTVKEKLKADIRAADLLAQEEKEKLYQYIETLPEGGALCHFDFHPGNLIMRNGQLVVIDWMTACRGASAADAARTGIMLRYAQAPVASKAAKRLLKWMQRKIYKVYLTEYMKCTETRREDIKRWEYPVMAARLCEWIPDEEKMVLLGKIREYSQSVH